jgi:hypothetical protein
MARQAESERERRIRSLPPAAGSPPVHRPSLYFDPALMVDVSACHPMPDFAGVKSEPEEPLSKTPGNRRAGQFSTDTARCRLSGGSEVDSRLRKYAKLQTGSG